MRGISIVAGVLAGSLTLPVVVAGAADMTVRAPLVPEAAHTWTGLYMSLGAGGMWGRSDWVFPASGSGTSPPFSAGVGSLGLGYQHQFGNLGMGGAGLVLGVETAGTFFLGDFNQGSICPVVIFTCQTRLSGLFTAGGRLGLAWESFMLYGAGGYAYGRVESRSFLTATGAPSTFAERGHDGWYAGAGIDWLAYRSRAVDVILGVEYQHVELGNRLHAYPPNPIATRTIDLTTDIAKAKLTLKINP